MFHRRLLLCGTETQAACSIRGLFPSQIHREDVTSKHDDLDLKDLIVQVIHKTSSLAINDTRQLAIGLR